MATFILAGCGTSGGGDGINPERNFAPPAANEPSPELTAPAASRIVARIAPSDWAKLAAVP